MNIGNLRGIGLAAVFACASFTGISEAHATHGGEIVIENYDGRDITDMTVVISYKANGVAYSDWEYIGDWPVSFVTLQLVNSPDANKLQTVSRAPWGGFPVIDIKNNDARDITNVRVEVWFRISGDVHYDYEDADFNYQIQGKELLIKANAPGTPPTPGATTWDGEKWVGNILFTSLEF